MAKTVACPQWSPLSAYGGVCALGINGGRPSFGRCLHACEHGPRLAADHPDGAFADKPSEPIPDSFNPERERRRLRQGGCCGPPSEA